MSIVTGPPPKRPGLGARPRKATELSLVPRTGPPPELIDASKMLKQTRDAWASFWSSPLCSVLVPESDLPALTRMFHLSDELERCRRGFAKERLVLGSMGQLVISPLGSFMLALAKEVRSLEDRFGGSVVSRLRLSIDLDAASRSLDAMNSRLVSGEEPDDVDVDPRTIRLSAP